MKTIIEEFLKFIQIEKGLSENTIGAYRRDLAKYEEYMKNIKLLISILSTPSYTRMLRIFIDQGASAKSMARFISTIRNFHQFALREKYAAKDPTVLIETPEI